MNEQTKDLQLVGVTELFSHLYLGLTRYLEWIYEKPEKSEETRGQSKKHIKAAWDGLEIILSRNSVVQESVEKECTLVFLIVKEATNGGITPRLMEKMSIERAKLQTKIVALTDLVALFKVL